MTPTFALLLALIVIDPDARTVDPGDFAVVTTTLPEESTTTTVETAESTTTSVEESTTTTTESSTTSSSESTTTTSSTSTTTQVTIPPAPTGKTYYLSPTGNDNDLGTNASAPWKTFGKVFSTNKLLQPGDTLVLLDGEYKRLTTGLPKINCDSNARDGTASKPITIRAKNERKAWLHADGTTLAPFQMDNCSWWKVEGLRGSNTDNASGTQEGAYVFHVLFSTDIQLRRLLGHHNNRLQNAHIYEVSNSQRVLIEESEALFYHRHGFSIWRSRYVTLRRNYANSFMANNNDGCCSAIDNRDQGDEAMSFYGTSDSIAENMISEQANGFQIHGIANSLDPSGSGGRNNRILGCISLDDPSVSVLISSRSTGSSYRNALGNTVRDTLVVGHGGNGIYVRGAGDTTIENVTVAKGTKNGGFVQDNGDSGVGGTCGSANPQGCKLGAENVLAFNNKTVGIGVLGSAVVEYSNSFGNATQYSPSGSIEDDSGVIRMSRSQGPAPTCLLKAGSAGGATIQNRYIDGRLSGVSLWNSDGSFPCGAVIAGVNDGSRACRNVHMRLKAGCS